MSERLAAVWALLTSPFPLFLLGVGVALVLVLWAAQRRDEQADRGGARVIGQVPSPDFKPPTIHLDGPPDA